MNCTKCGKDAGEGMRFCGHCGKLLTDHGQNAYKERRSIMSCYTKAEVALLEMLKEKYTLTTTS